MVSPSGKHFIQASQRKRTDNKNFSEKRDERKTRKSRINSWVLSLFSIILLIAVFATVTIAANTPIEYTTDKEYPENWESFSTVPTAPTTPWATFATTGAGTTQVVATTDTGSTRALAVTDDATAGYSQIMNNAQSGVDLCATGQTLTFTYTLTASMIALQSIEIRASASGPTAGTQPLNSIGIILTGQAGAGETAGVYMRGNTGGAVTPTPIGTFTLPAIMAVTMRNANCVGSTPSVFFDISGGGLAVSGLQYTTNTAFVGTMNSIEISHQSTVASVTGSSRLDDIRWQHAPLPAPTTTGISPTSGSALGGTPVTITGTGYKTGATVTVGGSALTGVTVVSGTSITGTTTGHASGLVNVVVTNPDTQSGTLTNGYTYNPAPAPLINSLTPDNGIVEGGTTITVAGQNFRTGFTATFDGTPAFTTAFISSTSVQVQSPPHAAGTITFILCNTDSQCANAQYTYGGSGGGGGGGNIPTEVTISGFANSGDQSDIYVIGNVLVSAHILVTNNALIMTKSVDNGANWLDFSTGVLNAKRPRIVALDSSNIAIMFEESGITDSGCGTSPNAYRCDFIIYTTNGGINWAGATFTGTLTGNAAGSCIGGPYAFNGYTFNSVSCNAYTPNVAEYDQDMFIFSGQIYWTRGYISPNAGPGLVAELWKTTNMFATQATPISSTIIDNGFGSFSNTGQIDQIQILNGNCIVVARSTGSTSNDYFVQAIGACPWANVVQDQTVPMINFGQDLRIDRQTGQFLLFRNGFAGNWVAARYNFQNGAWTFATLGSTAVVGTSEPRLFSTTNALVDTAARHGFVASPPSNSYYFGMDEGNAFGAGLDFSGVITGTNTNTIVNPGMFTECITSRQYYTWKGAASGKLSMAFRDFNCVTGNTTQAIALGVHTLGVTQLSGFDMDIDAQYSIITRQGPDSEIIKTYSPTDLSLLGTVNTNCEEFQQNGGDARLDGVSSMRDNVAYVSCSNSFNENKVNIKSNLLGDPNRACSYCGDSGNGEIDEAGVLINIPEDMTNLAGVASYPYSFDADEFGINDQTQNPLTTVASTRVVFIFTEWETGKFGVYAVEFRNNDLDIDGTARQQFAPNGQTISDICSVRTDTSSLDLIVVVHPGVGLMAYSFNPHYPSSGADINPTIASYQPGPSSAIRANSVDCSGDKVVFGTDDGKVGVWYLDGPKRGQTQLLLNTPSGEINWQRGTTIGGFNSTSQRGGEFIAYVTLTPSGSSKVYAYNVNGTLLNTIALPASGTLYGMETTRTANLLALGFANNIFTIDLSPVTCIDLCTATNQFGAGSNPGVGGGGTNTPLPNPDVTCNNGVCVTPSPTGTPCTINCNGFVGDGASNFFGIDIAYISGQFGITQGAMRWLLGLYVVILIAGGLASVGRGSGMGIILVSVGSIIGVGVAVAFGLLPIWLILIIIFLLIVLVGRMFFSGGEAEG